nr:hypothetical protein [Marinicella sp. W31]MDC2877324.1 hypothetical protein [Marinicella sp. W31]
MIVSQYRNGQKLKPVVIVSLDAAIQAISQTGSVQFQMNGGEILSDATSEATVYLAANERGSAANSKMIFTMTGGTIVGAHEAVQLIGGFGADASKNSQVMVNINETTDTVYIDGAFDMIGENIDIIVDGGNIASIEADVRQSLSAVFSGGTFSEAPVDGARLAFTLDENNCFEHDNLIGSVPGCRRDRCARCIYQQRRDR